MVEPGWYLVRVPPGEEFAIAERIEHASSIAGQSGFSKCCVPTYPTQLSAADFILPAGAVVSGHSILLDPALRGGEARARLIASERRQELEEAFPTPTEPRPLYRGFVFVYIDDYAAALDTLGRVEGVAGFFPSTEAPARAPTKDVERLLARSKQP